MSIVAPKNIKLTYFDLPGRAEAARVALTIGGIDFEDVRVTGEEFSKIKPTLSGLQQLPQIEVDGERLGQGNAIARYAAKLAGLYPTDAFEALRADVVVETIEDALRTLGKTSSLPDEEKAGARREMVAEGGPIAKLALSIEDSASEEGPFFLSSGVSLADTFVYAFIATLATGMFDGLSRESFPVERFPKLNRIFDAVRDHERVKAYLAKLAAAKAESTA